MYEGFKSRAAAVRQLLGRADVGFVIVASPSPVSVDEALYFHQHLQAQEMPIAGVVANRVAPDLWPADGPLPSAETLAAALPGDASDLPARLARTLADHQVFARADRREVERLFAVTEGAKAAIPRLEADVHDLAGLAALASRL
jgi:anion-transporting  ArsA/GET3 family ATPase